MRKARSTMNTQENEESTTELHGVTLAQDAKPDDIEGLRQRGAAVVKAAHKMMSKYFDLTDWIREKQLTDSIVRRELLPYLPKTRISEVLKVAQVSPKLYAEFKSRAVGFKLALTQARNEGSAHEEQDDFTAKDFKQSIYNFMVRQAARTSKPGTMPNFIRKGSFKKDGLEIEWKVKRIVKDNTPQK